MTDLDAATFEGVAFLGNTLPPFFLQDPRTGSAEAEFAAVAALEHGLLARNGRLPAGKRPHVIWQ